MKSGVSRAEANKAIRQEALREKLANSGLVQHVLENSSKIQDLDNPLEPADVNRLKVASELQLKLINKYLPDVKQVELEANMNVSGDMVHRLVRAVEVNGSSSST